MTRTLLVAVGLALCACGPATRTVNLKRGDTIVGVAGLTELNNPADNRVHQTAVQVSLFGAFKSGETFQLSLLHGACPGSPPEAFRLDDLTVGTDTSAPAQSATVIDISLARLEGGGPGYALAAVELSTSVHPTSELFGCGDIP